MVSQVFYDEIVSRKGWSVLNWDTLLRIGEYTPLKLPPSPSNQQLAEFGRKIGLGAILFGSVLDFKYRVTGNGMVVPVISFSAKLIDTGTGRIVWTGLSSVVGNMNSDSLTTLLRRIVDNMLSDIERRSGNARIKCNAEVKVWKLFEGVSTAEIGKARKSKVLSKGAERIYNLILTRKKFILEGLKFRGRTTTLDDKSIAILNALGEVLKNYPGVRLKIEVHTDASGNAAADRKLTEMQARYIFQYLVSRFNISPNRIEIQPMGSDYPLLPNISRRNRELNRRVEIVVLER